MYIAQVRIWLYIEDCRSNYNPNALPVHELQKKFYIIQINFQSCTMRRTLLCNDMRSE